MRLKLKTLRLNHLVYNVSKPLTFSIRRNLLITLTFLITLHVPSLHPRPQCSGRLDHLTCTFRVRFPSRPSSFSSAIRVLTVVDSSFTFNFRYHSQKIPFRLGSVAFLQAVSLLPRKWKIYRLEQREISAFTPRKHQMAPSTVSLVFHIICTKLQMRFYKFC